MKAEETDKTLGLGLCYRCEHRAVFLETGDRPRFECGMERSASPACYMFLPCKPIAVAAIEGEKRPMFGPPVIAGRLQSHGLVPDERLKLEFIKIDKKLATPVWTIQPIKRRKA